MPNRSVFLKSRALPVAAAALAGVLALSACTSGPSDPDAPPSPDFSPHSAVPSPDPSTAPPEGSVSAAQLPDGDQMPGGGWTDGETRTGSGDAPVSACQLNKFESTGANSIQVRTFTRDRDTAAAVVLSFADPAAADLGQETLAGWLSNCSEILASNGIENANHSVTAFPVTIPDGTATVDDWAWSVEAAALESTAVIRSGDRIAWITTHTNATPIEANDQHPTVAAVPELATRLTS